MPLIHRSFCVQASVWKKLRINAIQSGVPIRDLLAYLIDNSRPIPEGQSPERQQLEAVVKANSESVAAMGISGVSDNGGKE